MLAKSLRGRVKNFLLRYYLWSHGVTLGKTQSEAQPNSSVSGVLGLHHQGIFGRTEVVTDYHSTHRGLQQSFRRGDECEICQIPSIGNRM